MIFKRIYNIVRQIPKSKVLTYKKIADLLEIKDIRLIGYALHQNKNPQIIPCHRVVKSDGSLAKGYTFGGEKKQKEILEKEGITFDNKNKINLQKYLWR